MKRTKQIHHLILLLFSLFLMSAGSIAFATPIKHDHATKTPSQKTQKCDPYTTPKHYPKSRIAHLILTAKTAVLRPSFNQGQFLIKLNDFGQPVFTALDYSKAATVSNEKFRKFIAQYDPCMTAYLMRCVIIYTDEKGIKHASAIVATRFVFDPKTAKMEAIYARDYKSPPELPNKEINEEIHIKNVVIIID